MLRESEGWERVTGGTGTGFLLRPRGPGPGAVDQGLINSGGFDLGFGSPATSALLTGASWLRRGSPSDPPDPVSRNLQPLRLAPASHHPWLDRRGQHPQRHRFRRRRRPGPLRRDVCATARWRGPGRPVCPAWPGVCCAACTRGLRGGSWAAPAPSVQVCVPCPPCCGGRSGGPGVLLLFWCISGKVPVHRASISE